MSFLDRFKRKAQDPNAPDAEADSPAEITPGAPAPQKIPARKPDPTVQLAAATVASGYNPDLKRAQKKDKPADAPKVAADDGEMTLELGDFLRRIPQGQLKPGTHDPKTPLKFNLGELADRIARGQTTIPLHEVYKRVPAIFAAEVTSGDQSEIRFPWQKVMKLLAEVATATPGTGLNAASAGSLAEKLKSRRAVRNILPGQPTTGEAKANAEAKAKTARETRSKTTAPAPTQKAPSSAEAPLAPIAPLAPVSIPASSAPIEPAPLTPVPVSSAPANVDTPPGDDEQVSRDELIRARDAALLASARVKGEYERQLAAAAQDRKALAEERDRAAAELAAAQKEIADKLEQIEFEKSVAAKSTENLAKLQQERDALQRELKTKVESASAAATPDPRLGELTVALGALTEEKAQLATQLAELKKAADAASPLHAAELAAAKAEAERFKAAHASIETELHQTRTQLNAAEISKAADSDAGKAERADWESRAVAQLEADIESYRGRIKAILQERDAAAAEKEKLSTRLHELEAKTETSARSEGTAATLQAEVTRLTAELEQLRSQSDQGASSLRAQVEQLQRERDEHAGALKKLAAEHTAVVANSAPAQVVTELQSKLDEQVRALSVVIGERDLLAGKTKTLTEQLQATLEDHQRKVGETHATAGELQTALDMAVRDREGINALLANAREELESARQQNQKSLAHVITERDKAAGEAAAAQEELGRLRTDYENRLKQARTSRTELEQAHVAAIKDRETVQGQFNSLQSELESTRQQHASVTGTFAADRDRLAGEVESLKNELAKVGAELKSSHEAHAAGKGELEKQLAAANALRAELEGRNAELTHALDASQRQLEATNTNARTEREQAAKIRGDLEGRLAGLTSERDQLAEKLKGLTQELADARKDHGDAYAALDQQHRDLHAAKDALAAEFSSTRMAHEKEFAAITGERDTLGKAKETLEAQLAQATAKISALESRGQQLDQDLAAARAAAEHHESHAASLIVQHRDAIEAATGKHQRSIAALTTEKDAAIATLTAEKAALAASTDDKLAALATQHEHSLSALVADKAKELAALEQRLQQQIATVTGERDQTRVQLATAEKKIAELSGKLDTSEREATALAQQMAVTAVEADKKIAALTAERDRLLVDKKTLSSDLDEARESHKAQSGVFAREFKAVVKQRDDALAQLEADRKRYEQKAAELAQEKQALDKREEELGARFERDVARLRRERDVIAEQRDGLRRRLEELINQQRRVLDDVAAQATHSTRYAEPAPEPPPARTRETKPRVEKEPNVIDIASADVAHAPPEQESGLKIPRVRPVIVPPPLVRIL